MSKFIELWSLQIQSSSWYHLSSLAFPSSLRSSIPFTCSSNPAITSSPKQHNNLFFLSHLPAVGTLARPHTPNLPPGGPRWSPVIVRSDIRKRLLTHYSWEIFPGTCCVFFSMSHKWREFIIRGFYLVRRSLNANGFFIFSLLFHSFSLVMVCGRSSKRGKISKTLPWAVIEVRTSCSVLVHKSMFSTARLNANNREPRSLKITKPGLLLNILSPMLWTSVSYRVEIHVHVWNWTRFTIKFIARSIKISMIDL